MIDNVMVGAPGGFAGIVAASFSDPAGNAVPVTRVAPMPVETLLPEAVPAAVTGTLAASGASAAFAPRLGRALWLTLRSGWSGSVTLERSADGGATWDVHTLGGAPLAWTAPLCEAVTLPTEAGSQWRVAFARASGTLAYRLAQ